MLYPKFSRSLVSFLLVLILHVFAIWLLLSPEKPQAKIHTPKVLLASLVAPATPKNNSAKASSKTVRTEPVSAAKLKTASTTAITTKPKSEKKPEPKIKALKPTPLPIPSPKIETEQNPVEDTIETVMPETEQDHGDLNEASYNATTITNETEQAQDQAQDQVVTEIKVDAHSTQNFPPVYPKISKRLKEQGTVILSMLISAQGQIEAISIEESSGFTRLDQSALSAAAKWRYEPATINGTAIAKTYLMPIEFKLNTSKRL